MGVDERTTPMHPNLLAAQIAHQTTTTQRRLTPCPHIADNLAQASDHTLTCAAVRFTTVALDGIGWPAIRETATRKLPARHILTGPTLDLLHCIRTGDEHRIRRIVTLRRGLWQRDLTLALLALVPLLIDELTLNPVAHLDQALVRLNARAEQVCGVAA